MKFLRGSGMLSEETLAELFGSDPVILRSKRAMLETISLTFYQRFAPSIEKDNIHLICTPNRVEMLGKHTDYQGGETLILTGPKNFFALAAPATDGVTHLVNADPRLGDTILRLKGNKPVSVKESVGSQYTIQVAARLMRNLNEAGFPPLENVKAAFLSDIPIGGGTSGSSAKVITDFLILTTTNSLIASDAFRQLITENGKKAGLRLNQQGLDDFLLSLSMYIAHYENGLDFGDLKGDRGVGTFGGSEDHTAILLGTQGRLLLCRYCPTELLSCVPVPEGQMVVNAYSGKPAEKTRDAMDKYNRLSGVAAEAVGTLNRILGTNHGFLRDFFPELPAYERAAAAEEKLRSSGLGPDLVERAYQFFRERDIIEKAVTSLEESRMEEYGRLINESHDLSRDCLKNIAPEVESLKQLANELGAYGATGFGGGFGGSCYALVDGKNVGSFVEDWRAAYLKRFPHYRDRASFDVYPPCRGAYWSPVTN
jgi:galactokinase